MGSGMSVGRVNDASRRRALSERVQRSTERDAARIKYDRLPDTEQQTASEVAAVSNRCTQLCKVTNRKQSARVHCEADSVVDEVVDSGGKSLFCVLSSASRF